MRAIAGGTPTRGDIRAYLALQLSLHAPMEASLARWMTSDWNDVRLRKAEWLRGDLRGFGPLPPALQVSLPVIRSRAGALGMSYVLEGGTLGLQIVRKRLAAAHVARNAAGRFLLGYGADTGNRWKGFVSALDAVAPAEWPQAISVAQATFAEFHRMFSTADVVVA